MKKNILITCLFILFAAPLFAQSFGSDITIEANTLNQRNVELTTAYNGWIYSAFSTVNEVTGEGGITIRKSIDGGLTWSTIDSYNVPDTRYDNLDILVAGTDTNALTLYLMGVNKNTVSGAYIIYVDRYNATTGAFIGSNYNVNKGTNPVYDVEIASDYLNPAVGVSPYSVQLMYSCYSSTFDSIVGITSIDGGNTFTNYQPIATTGAFFHKIALAYGRSDAASNGRYFAVWEQRNSNLATNCGIYTSRNVSQVTGAWTQKVNLDSLSSSMINLCSNPRIAVQQSAVDNDSASVTAVILVDRDYNGDGSDMDVLGFYNKRAHFSNFWYRLDVNNTGEQDKSPDIIYVDTTKTFEAVYFDSTEQQLTLISNDFNLVNADSWIEGEVGMNDDSLTTQNPLPRITFRPGLNEIGLAWADEGVNAGIIKFDIEHFGAVGLDEAKKEFSAVLYPNPVKHELFIELEEGLAQQPMELLITDLNGRIVYTASLNGESVISVVTDAFSTGTYLLRLTNANGFASRLFVKE